MTDRRREKIEQHELNKRTVVELTTVIAAVAAAAVVGLHALIGATATAPDVPRVTTAQYR